MRDWDIDFSHMARYNTCLIFKSSYGKAFANSWFHVESVYYIKFQSSYVGSGDSPKQNLMNLFEKFCMILKVLLTKGYHMVQL